MKVYTGGMLEKNCRELPEDCTSEGNLAVIVTRGESPNTFDIFQYRVLSDEFVNLTGVRTVRCPVERLYIGINREATENITRKNDYLTQGKVTFRDLDRLVVMSYFLDRE